MATHALTLPRDALAATRAELLEARHLPGDFHHSPEVYRLEIEKIFMRDWLCTGRVEQHEKPSDYRALRIAGEPVLVCRDRNGHVNAFANVCRHRGVEVATGRGNRADFMCPYHGWTSDPEGRLVGAPLNKGVRRFDFDGCRLLPVRLETWGGYVFVDLDPDAPSLATWLDDDGVRRTEAVVRPADTRIADEYVLEVDCNWKFIPENLMDVYHTKVVHGQSFAKHCTLANFPFELAPDGRYHAEYESLTMAPDGVSLFGPMPWMRDRSPLWACTLYVRPTFNLFARYDLVQPWVALPLGPEKTQITIWTQFPHENFDMPAFEAKNGVYEDFIRLVAEEDLAMLRSLQNGVKSRNFTPGPTVELEKAIHHLLDYYLDRGFGQDDGRSHDGR